MGNIKGSGTTIVGILCKDGVVLASERRATIGPYVASREVEKIYEIDRHIGFSYAGALADGATLARMMRVEAKLFRTRTGRPMGTEAAATLLSNIMFQYKIIPFLAQIILGGVDGAKPSLWSIDPIGGLLRESEFTFGGSGTPLVMAILDAEYVKGGSVSDNVPVAIKAINSAIKRDIFSGDGVDVVTVTKEGFRRWSKEEIEKMMEKEKIEKKKK